MPIPEHLVKSPTVAGPINTAGKSMQPPVFSATASPVQLKKDPKSLDQTLNPEHLSIKELEEEIGLLQTWIESNPSHADLHIQIMNITSYRDGLRLKTGGSQSPEKVTRKDYRKLHQKNKKKGIGFRKKGIKKLVSPTGHQAGEGGWLESNQDNVALFDAYFKPVLPNGMTVDDLKILSSDFSKHNPGYKELPPPDLWPSTHKSLVLLKKMQGFNGIIYKVASAYRSFRVNALAGGAKASQHLKFMGLDVRPQGSLAKNESFMKFFYLTAGKKENMGLGFYNQGRQHVDAGGYRNWKWKKDLRLWRKRFVRHWGEEMAKKLENL